MHAKLSSVPAITKKRDSRGYFLPQPVTCGHPDRPNEARQMCSECYNKWLWANREVPENLDQSDGLIRFVISEHCMLCGDGFDENHRKCELHPQICKTCHAEYCECKVQGQVELMDLEEIAELPEEEQVPLLLARKMTLRLVGKNTNSLPHISTESSTDERVGSTEPRMHIERPWR